MADQAALRERIVECYAADHRGYHDTRHLLEVLDRVEDLLALPEAAGVDGDAVVLAAWFHDAVYDGRPDDEERSAALAQSTLAATGAPRSLVAEVARLVRLTHDHRPEVDDLAGQVLCDADLAILAADRERYDEYVHDVRREYAHLDDHTFRSGRAAVLRALLDKPTLFHTGFARDAWEDAARANIERELAGTTA
jgi:predicted metal-dependent HD superfamily phosphohydrolase